MLNILSYSRNTNSPSAYLHSHKIDTGMLCDKIILDSHPHDKIYNMTHQITKYGSSFTQKPPYTTTTYDLQYIGYGYTKYQHRHHVGRCHASSQEHHYCQDSRVGQMLYNVKATTKQNFRRRMNYYSACNTDLVHVHEFKMWESTATGSPKYHHGNPIPLLTNSDWLRRKNKQMLINPETLHPKRNNRSFQLRGRNINKYVLKALYKCNDRRKEKPGNKEQQEYYYYILSSLKKENERLNTANSAENENLEYFRPMGKIETTPEEVHVQEDKRIMEILKEYGKYLRRKRKIIFTSKDKHSPLRDSLRIDCLPLHEIEEERQKQLGGRNYSKTYQWHSYDNGQPILHSEIVFNPYQLSTHFLKYRDKQSFLVRQYNRRINLQGIRKHTLPKQSKPIMLVSKQASLNSIYYQ